MKNNEILRNRVNPAGGKIRTYTENCETSVRETEGDKNHGEREPHAQARRSWCRQMTHATCGFSEAQRKDVLLCPRPRSPRRVVCPTASPVSSSTAHPSDPVAGGSAPAPLRQSARLVHTPGPLHGPPPPPGTPFPRIIAPLPLASFKSLRKRRLFSVPV